MRLAIYTATVVLAVSATVTAQDLPPIQGVPTVIYDNDATLDTYTDEYVMALATTGKIHLRGMVTTTSVAPYNPAVDSVWLPLMSWQRQNGINLAREAGFARVPDGSWGSIGHLARPASGSVDQTQPIESYGASLIVAEARNATPKSPLVVIVGGPLTTVVSAYLIDPVAVGSNVLVVWIGGSDHGMNDYNGFADEWASAVALARMQIVIFMSPLGYDPSQWISTPHERMRAELPDTGLRTWMLSKDLGNGDPCNGDGCRDGDGTAAVYLEAPGYARSYHRVCGSGYVRPRDGGPHYVPGYRADPNGDCRAWLVTRVDAFAGTEAWWATMRAAFDGVGTAASISTSPSSGESAIRIRNQRRGSRAQPYRGIRLASPTWHGRPATD